MVLLVTSTFAGVPVALPAGEQPAHWSAPLALGQLEWSSPPSADIQVVVDAGRWVVRVEDPDGAIRTTSVAIPTTPEAREDLVWLMVSLLTPVETAAPIPEPQLVPSVVPRVSAVSPPAPPAPVAISTVPVSAMGTSAGRTGHPEGTPRGKPDDGWEPEGWASLQPVPKPPPAPERSLPPPAPARPPRDPLIRIPPPPDEGMPRTVAWFRASIDAALRNGLPAQGTLWVSGGASREAIALGGGLGLATPTPLRDAGPARSYDSLPLYGELLFTPRYGLLGVAAGTELRRFRDDGTTVRMGAMPFLRATSAVSIYLGRHLWLEPGLGYRLDLGVTEIEVGGVRVQQLPASAWQGGLAMRWR